MLLLPEAFGGEDVPLNIVYIPQFAADAKASSEHNVILPLAIEGKVTRYTAAPEYSGRSFVPIALKLKASNPSEFTYDISIWGEALTRR